MIIQETQGFAYYSGTEKIGEIHFRQQANLLFAYHTYVSPAARGQGIAQKLLDALANYAREHHYQIVAQCSYVQAVFERHKEKYQTLRHQD